MNETSIAPQLLRYGGAGLFGTAAHYCVLGALVRGAGLGLVTASTCGAISGACVNYALNYRYTFRSRRAHRHALLAFWCVATTGWLLNAAVLTLLSGAAGVAPIPAQLLATAAVLLLGFFANRSWTF